MVAWVIKGTSLNLLILESDSAHVVFYVFYVSIAKPSNR